MSTQSFLNLRNGLWSGAEFAANFVSLLVLIPMILNRDGGEALGLFILANSVMGLCGMFSFGLGQATLKMISEYRVSGKESRVSNLVNASLWIYGGIGLCIVTLMHASSHWLATSVFGFGEEWSDVGSRTLIFAGYGLFAYLFVEMFAAVFQAYERYDISSSIRTFFRIFALGGQILLLYLGYGVEQLILLQFISLVFMVFALFLKMKITLVPSHTFYSRPNKQEIRYMLDYGGITWLGSLFGALRSRGDIFLVGGLLGPEAVSIYSVSLKLLSQVHALLAKCFHFLFPYVGKLYAAEKKVELLETYNRYTLLLAFAGMIMVVPLAVCANPILTLWLNKEVADQAEPLMRIMSIRFVVFPLSIVNSFFLLGTGKVRLMTSLVALSCVLSLASIGLGGYAYGLAGAAWGQLAFLPIILLNRALIERSLFGSMNWFRIVVPAICCLVSLGLALSFKYFFPPSMTWQWIQVIGFSFFIPLIVVSSLAVFLGFRPFARH